MTLFITQGNYTQQAISAMTQAPEDREAVVAKLVESAGGKLHAMYLTFGEYDFLLVAEAPNEAAITAAILAAAAGGSIANLRTTVAMSTKEAVKAFKRAGELSKSFRSAGKK
jgi:uncharacterized protein with GYD domain